jgi:uncharacterized membrane protein
MPLRRPFRVLLRLAYLILCRFIQLLALLDRGDAAKDPEILVLRHQLTVLQASIRSIIIVKALASLRFT